MQKKLIKCSVKSPSRVCILKGILGKRTQRSNCLVVKIQILGHLNGGDYFKQAFSGPLPLTGTPTITWEKKSR